MHALATFLSRVILPAAQHALVLSTLSAHRSHDARVHGAVGLARLNVLSSTIARLLYLREYGRNFNKWLATGRWARAKNRC